MRKEELLQKNVILGGEFTKYVLEHPELLETIPKGAHVFVLPENDPELLRANLELAQPKQRTETSSVPTTSCQTSTGD